MAYWVAKLKPQDMPFAEDLYLGVDGQEYGFVVIDSEGETHTDFPFMTDEEAVASIKEDFEPYYSTFQWLNNK